ncbi:hypothetical protein GCM10011352_16610 [Marinobacterium zhoushanense]|uniref:Carrier domain-containing protein n=1 Tax=Marinobacterium zhoushanense TaxID=1679163 RepID=A0ABQ1K7W9_9GAMM|nr:acyl carrier protein [Marinobacterium zhoushanense]GGB91253.1 hypothetical protein GCM10011352_16610 [Marinobacterium zhoushanense]
MENTPDQVRAILQRELGNIAPEADLDTLAPTVDLREELDIDSFDFVRYIAAVSEALDVDVPEQDYMQFSTLQGAQNYLLNLP